MDQGLFWAFLGTLVVAVGGGFGVLFKALLNAESGRTKRAETQVDQQLPLIGDMARELREMGSEIAKLTELLNDQIRAEREERLLSRGRPDAERR